VRRRLRSDARRSDHIGDSLEVVRLVEEEVRASLPALATVGGARVVRQHDHNGALVRESEPREESEPVLTGQVQIENDYGNNDARGRIDRFDRVARLEHLADARQLAQQHDEARANGSRVIDDEDFHD
jgi:hypothetical protein